MKSQIQREKKKKNKEEIKKEIEQLKEDLGESKEIEEKLNNSITKIIQIEDIITKQEELPKEEYKIGYLKEAYPWTVEIEKFPWMFWVPEKDRDIKNWLNEWSDFSLQWFKLNMIHVISFTDLMENKPFVFLQDKTNALILIIERLIKQKYCYYINEEKNSIRILWRNLEDWVNFIFDWAFKRGSKDFTLFELISLPNSIDNFHKLPIEDLKKILELMVRQLRARWVSKDNYHVELII
jgi:hypothetical protein